MGIWHLTLSSVGRRVIFDDEARLLLGVHALARVAGRETVLFSFVDDHVHVVASTDRPGVLGAGLRRSLGAITPVELEPVHRREVANRRHLEWLANDYVMKQTARHGVGGHPALWPGSCFLDLAGARRIQGLELQLLRVLPRYRLRNAFLAVGLEPVPLAPPGSAGLWAAGVARIVAASCAAVGACEAVGRSRRSRRARLVAARLCREAGLGSGILAAHLGHRTTSVCKQMRQGCDDGDRRAALTRLALEDRVLAVRPTASRSSR